jgi:small-conductance mechanosensitive channel
MFEIIENIGISGSQYINALLTIAFYIVIAILVNLFITRVLKKLVSRTKTNLDDDIIRILHIPVFLTIILYSVVYSVASMNLSHDYLFYTSNFIYSVIAILWMIAFIRISNEIVKSAVNKSASDTSGLSRDIAPLLGNIIKFAIFIAGLMTLLSIWSIDITPLLASAGIVGVAAAIAAKDTLSNFFGGISIFFDKPYKIGDYIDLEGKERGEVVHIGIRSTRIKTRDDIQISIPNSIIANSKIINESAPVPKFRIRIPVGIAYGSDVDKVQSILIQIAIDNNNVHDDPEPRVRFREFGDHSLKFELLCWAEDPALRGLTIHELNLAIYNAFNKHGIEIPFPQTDINIKNK